MAHSRDDDLASRVEGVLTKTSDYFARLDGKAPGASASASRRYARSARSVGKRLANMGMAIAALIVATLAFGLVVQPIGWTGLFIVALAIMAILVLFSMAPAEPKRVAYSEQLPTKTVVRQLDSFLVSQRPALPAPAVRRIDAISAQLPLLESRLAEVDLLDPLAQDARRLMGKHLPELIDRYDRVPAAYRHERDGEGLTVDERLVAGLDAANTALGEIGAKLAREDLSAFETQGRFIESRYRDGELPKGG